jgi:hypothetical protein
VSPHAAFSPLRATVRHTCREMFRLTRSPICEYEPAERREARLSDPYHAIAVTELTGREPLRLCADCANQHFPHRGQRPVQKGWRT